MRMRIVAIGLAGLLLLTGAAFYLGILGAQPTHISALVPDDFLFGVFYSSLNDLEQAYEGPYRQKNYDPGRRRVGIRINAPGLNGIAQDRPLGSAWMSDLKEVFYLPYTDFGAYQDAHAVSRENVQLKDPHKAGGDYLSVSESDLVAKRGPDNPLLSEVDDYPVMLVGHPRDASVLRTMLYALLAPDANKHPARVYPLSTEVRGIPNRVLAFAARQCDDLLVGLTRMKKPSDPAEIVIRARPAGALARAGAVAREVNLGELLGALPIQTVLFAGAVADGKGWEEAGLPLPLGDGAFVFAILEAGQVHARLLTQKRARPYTVVMAAKPKDLGVLAKLHPDGFLDGEPPAPRTVKSGKAEIRTSRLEAPPAWARSVLRSHARKPPDIYVSTAVEGGIWFCAIGSWAEEALSHTLGCLRGASELSVRSAKMKPLDGHRTILAAGHVGAVLVTPMALEALDYPIPFVELGSIGQVYSATFVLDVEEKATGLLRIVR